MSTVKAINFQHPNSSNINMVLASDGSVSGGFPAGGRNKIINGGFDVWQRGTSFSVNGSYTADRWAMVCASGQTVAASQQLFTAGNPITGYEPTAYLRISWSGTPSGTFWFTQRIEDVRTFAGQTVTLSFWAKASSATSVFVPMLEQNFGSGGSGGASVNGNAISLTTSWQRFSQTFNVPSISGKTIGTNSYLDVRPLFGGSSVNGINVDIWGVQLEAGSIATPFEVKPYAQELRDCQRYCFKINATGAYGTYGNGWSTGTGASNVTVQFPVTMRATPDNWGYNGISELQFTTNGGATIYTVAITAAESNPQRVVMYLTHSAVSQGLACQWRSSNNAAGFLYWTAEL